MMVTFVNVAHDFSPMPMGRTERHGYFNGARFRDEVLVPALGRGLAVIDLTGTRGRSASFLDEAFGRLLECGFTLSRLKATLEVRADDDPLVPLLVWDLIQDRATWLQQSQR